MISKRKRQALLRAKQKARRAWYLCRQMYLDPVLGGDEWVFHTRTRMLFLYIDFRNRLNVKDTDDGSEHSND